VLVVASNPPKRGTLHSSQFRQRTLAQLEAFIKTAEMFHKLPALREAASHLFSLLQMLWVDTPPLSLYPAFDHPLVG
jgi:hypothetical protein